MGRFVHLLHGIEAFGDGDTGRYSDDADFLRAKFHGQDAGDDVDGRLGSAIDGAGGRGCEGDSGADVDDHAAVGTEVGNGRLGGEQKGFDVEVEVFVDVLDGYGFEWKELVDAGVVDKDVEAAESLGCRGDELAYFGRIGQIGLDGDGFTAGGLDPFDEGFSGSGAAGVVDDDGGAVRGQTLCDGCSYAFRGASYDCDFTFKIGHCFSPGSVTVQMRAEGEGIRAGCD